MPTLNTLRPISHRLNSTPVEELPRYAAVLAASLLNSSNILQSQTDQKSDVAVQVHKLTTRISSLLQDRSQAGRFTGIVLTKALVEACGPQTLAASGLTWVRALIACLHKQDPPEVKRLAIYAVTRVYILTKNDQSMVREITTPTLPAFANACLNLLKPSTRSKDTFEPASVHPLLDSVFQCWARLIKIFPSTLRPFVPSIRVLTLNTLREQTTSTDLRALASEVFALLHFCAPKNDAASEWLSSCSRTIESAHQSIDIVLRSVIEEWSLTDPYHPSATSRTRSTGQIQLGMEDTLGVGTWKGLREGCHRVSVLLDLLGSLLRERHAQIVHVPLAQVLNLIARLAAVFPPNGEEFMIENKDITRDEREELYSNLPGLHVAAIDIIRILFVSYRSALVPVTRPLSLQVLEMFVIGQSGTATRIAAYSAMAEILPAGGVALRQSESSVLAVLVYKCCADLRFAQTSADALRNSEKEVKSGVLTTGLKDTQIRRGTDDSSQSSLLFAAAWNLLPAVLSHTPPELLNSTVRAEIDRTAIISGHKEAMLASVVNPARGRKGAANYSSILPFLFRQDDYDLACEALIRPRMPALGSSTDMQLESEVTATNPESLRPPAIRSLESSTPIAEEMSKSAETIAELLEPEFSRDGTHTAQEKSKREFGTLEDESTQAEIELPKKIKLSEGLPEKHPISSDHLGTTDVTQTDIGHTVMTSEQEDEPMVLVSSSTAIDAEIPDMKENISAVTTASMSTSFVPQIDDDSDDSEIPQIDATLSSDDEDEAD